MMRQDDPPTAEDGFGLSYAFKPSLAGNVSRLRLAPDALEWEIGFRSGRIPYRDIERVRLSFRPKTLQTNRFLAEIWSASAPKLSIASSSWKSVIEHERLDAAYVAFVTELHRRLSAAGSKARFDAGNLPLLYWPGLAIFIGLSLVLAHLGVRALETASWEATVIVFGLLALFLWQTGAFFRRNRPGSYSPERPPSRVLPGG